MLRPEIIHISLNMTTLGPYPSNQIWIALTLLIEFREYDCIYKIHLFKLAMIKSILS